MDLGITDASTGSPSLEIRLLGALTLAINCCAVSPPDRARVRSLIEVLALRHPTPVTRDVLIDFLWPEMDESSGRNNLHVTVFAARRALAPLPGGGIRYDRCRGHYRLDPSLAISVDVEDFRQLVQNARVREVAGDLKAAVDSYCRADSLYVGDLLADQPYADAFLTERRGLREMWLGSLDRMAGLLERLGRPVEARWVAERTLEIEPLDERAAERQIRLLVEHGQVARALGTLREFERRLYAELGIRLSGGLASLVTELDRSLGLATT
jgi:DNA-binding SARP family transcriptional activator